MEWYLYPLIIAAGFLAGVINTLAGSGSLVTLPLLMFLGLPAGVANGTNRIGVLFQGVVAVQTLRRRTNYEYKSSWWIVAIAAAGAVLGAKLAIEVDEVWLNRAILGLMIFMLVVILVEPKKWLREGLPNPKAIRNPLYWLLFFCIGVYGGFIQAGVGIFLLAGLVLAGGYNLVHANAVKLVVVLVYSVLVLAIFQEGGQVNWGYGLLLAVGQMLGAWVAARFAADHPKARTWIRYLLIAVVIASIAKFAIAGF